MQMSRYWQYKETKKKVVIADDSVASSWGLTKQVMRGGGGWMVGSQPYGVKTRIYLCSTVPALEMASKIELRLYIVVNNNLYL